MSLKWSDRLVTGNQTIDRQHRELLERMNRFSDSIANGTSQEDLDSLAGFLRGYIENHFSAEEDWMERTGDPAFRTHKAEHDDFRQRFDEIWIRIRKSSKASLDMHHLNFLLSDWWFNHILRTDQGMVKEHPKEQPVPEIETDTFYIIQPERKRKA